MNLCNIFVLDPLLVFPCEPGKFVYYKFNYSTNVSREVLYFLAVIY